MELFVVVQQMLVLFAMMLIGYILVRLRWMDETITSALSRLVVNVFNPFLIISSVLGQKITDTGMMFWQNLILVGVFYLILFLAGFLIVLLLRINSSQSPIYRILTLLPNCGFMGIPVVSALLGTDYIIYVAVYMLVYNIIMYTYGIHLVRQSGEGRGEKEKHTLFGQVKRIFCNCGVAASVLALVFFFGGIQVPGSIQVFCDYMGNPCVPLSMMLIGCSLASVPFSAVFRRGRMYGFLVIKMLLLPALGALLVHLIPFERTIQILFIIMLSMPAGSMVVLVTDEYKGDVGLASAGVVLSTLVSIVTIPAVSLLM